MPTETFANLGAQTSKTDYLRFIASLPFTSAYVERSVELLGLRSGQSLADFGCGLAHDARRLCEAIAPNGKIVFIDSDPNLLHLAQRASIGHTHGVQTSFDRQDAHSLELASGSVDASRIVRTLMHVDTPSIVIAEMARITKSEGRVLAIEPDWTTWSEAVDADLSTAIREAICAGIRHPGIGSELEKLFSVAGISGLHTERIRMSFNDPGLAEKAFLIEHKLTELITDGRANANARELHNTSVARAKAAGQYECGVDFIICVGGKEG